MNRSDPEQRADASSGPRPGDDERVRRAARFAIEAHGDQLYGERPYRAHLEAVAALLEPHGVDAMIVGYLHDVVEDTGVTLDELRRRFGALVADCVALLSDAPGDSRAERKRATYAKMAAVRGELELALLVKAADRLANLQACLDDRRAELMRTYRDEHQAFYQAAFRPGLCDELWQGMQRVLDAAASWPQSD